MYTVVLCKGTLVLLALVDIINTSYGTCKRALRYQKALLRVVEIDIATQLRHALREYCKIKELFTFHTASPLRTRLKDGSRENKRNHVCVTLYSNCI